MAKSRKKTKKRNKKTRVQIPGAYSLLKQSVSLWWRHKFAFSMLTLLYGVTSILVVQTAESVTVESIQEVISGRFDNERTATAVTALIALYSGTQTGSAAVVYNMFLLVAFSLASIWMIRRFIAKQTFDFRDAFYSSMYPFFPYVLTCVIVLIQTVPFIIGSVILSLVAFESDGITFTDLLPFWALWVVLALGSAYLLPIGVLSTYAATLPDMRPMAAYRAVQNAATTMRWQILFKIIVFAMLLLLVGSLLLVLSIVNFPSITFILIDVLRVVLLPFVHIYLFLLYRSIVR